MLRRIMISLLLVGVSSSCATLGDYSPTQFSQSARVTVTRNFDQPLLGSSTVISKLNGIRDCRGAMDKQEDLRFMVLDDKNPLVKPFNENGVEVEAGTPLMLRFLNIAGDRICIIQATFTPEDGKEYEIRLSGRVQTVSFECDAELWSSKKDEPPSEKHAFSRYETC